MTTLTLDPTISSVSPIADATLPPAGWQPAVDTAVGLPPRPATSDGAPALDVFGALAHEMRGPLHALVTSAELLAQQLSAEQPSGEPVAGSRLSPQAVANAVHCRSLWLKGLVDNLLCAATIQRGRFEVQRQAVNLLDVVSEVDVVVEPLLAERGQRLRVRSTVAAPVTLGDFSRLSQALVNLILNASKFSPPEATITVIVAGTETEGALRVTVSDRGIGIPEEQAERLFEPYYRGRNAEATSGVGLGLSLVKSIVEAHGGAVNAARRPTGGSRFWLTLPALDAGGPRPC
jgi:signal transduction histidine kinase